MQGFEVRTTCPRIRKALYLASPTPAHPGHGMDGPNAPAGRANTVEEENRGPPTAPCGTPVLLRRGAPDVRGGRGNRRWREASWHGNRVVQEQANGVTDGRIAGRTDRHPPGGEGTSDPWGVRFARANLPNRPNPAATVPTLMDLSAPLTPMGPASTFSHGSLQTFRRFVVPPRPFGSSWSPGGRIQPRQPLAATFQSKPYVVSGGGRNSGLPPGSWVCPPGTLLVRPGS